MWTNQPGYSIFSDENNEKVYSPIPAKYLKKNTSKDFSMVLRPRIPLKCLNMVQQLTKSYVPLKASQAKNSQDENSAGVQGKSLKRKLHNTFDQIALKVGGKSRKVANSTEVKKTPLNRRYLSYRDRINGSPLTPFNPFNCSPTPALRRSARLSISPPNLCKIETRSAQKRKREYVPDEFSKHLEAIQGGIKKLDSNSDNITAAIEQNEKNHSQEQKDATTKQLDTLGGSISRSQKYKPLSESTPTRTSDNRGGKLRRTMSKASIKGRTLGQRMVKSASALDARLHGKAVYRDVEVSSGEKKLRGKYNKALYYDG